MPLFLKSRRFGPIDRKNTFFHSGGGAGDKKMFQRHERGNSWFGPFRIALFPPRNADVNSLNFLDYKPDFEFDQGFCGSC